MIKTKVAKDSMGKFYNVLSQGLFDSEYSIPCGSMYGILEKGQASVPHLHHEIEMFIILKGCGIIKNSESFSTITNGDIILSPPFESHSLVNEGDEELHFVSLWWDNESNIEIGLKDYLGKMQASQPDKALIVATPPTPNGDLHIGHLSGPFLNSDILRRIFELKNVPTKNICGIDDNQNYVLLKANQLNTTPEAISTNYGERIKETWQLANIHYDYLINPKEVEYKEFIDSFFKTLFEKGVLYEKVSDVFYDENDNYIFEAFIHGNCPHCNEMSDGLACEKCGMPNDCVDLINPTNKIGEKLIPRKEKRLFLKMHHFRDQLDAYLSKMDLTYRMTNLKNNLMKSLPDIAVTHPCKWGIESSIPGFENQRYYVWAEMAGGFLYASKKVDFELDNLGDEASYIQCFGFDNALFFMFLFPALNFGYNENIKLPTKFVTNEFLLLDGIKFSTSRGHAIWGNQILNDIDADFVRFYLARISPFGKESNFKMTDFIDFSVSLWEETFIPWMENINERFETFFDSKAPSSGAWTKNHIVFLDAMFSYCSSINERLNLQSFDPSKMASHLQYFIEESFSFSQKENFLYDSSDAKNEQRTSMYLELNALFLISSLIYPLMPEFSAKIKAVFKQQEPLEMDGSYKLRDLSFTKIELNEIRSKLNSIKANHDEIN